MSKKKKVHLGSENWPYCGARTSKQNWNRKKVTCKLCRASLLSGPRQLVRTRKRQLAMAEKEVEKILSLWE